MKALIFPFLRSDELAPLRLLSPDFLLPLAGKPMVEHLLEQLVTSGIRDITLLCDDRPEEVGRHFGNGERWGCSVSVSPARDRGGVRRMAQAAIHGAEGVVICLSGNLTNYAELQRILGICTRAEGGGFLEACGGAIVSADAVIMRELMADDSWTTVEELGCLAGLKGSLQVISEEASMVTTLQGFLDVQRALLEGGSGVRIPGTAKDDGIWLADHTVIAPSVRLIPPLFIGSHSRISGSGQIGPNAVISAYCLVNNTDLICDSLVMAGTATGPHTELNGKAARGAALLNLRSGAFVTAPDPFILGDVSGGSKQQGCMACGRLAAAVLLLALMPLGLPLLLLSYLAPGITVVERRLGNRRIRTLSGENPRTPFTLRQFRFGPLLLQRWPALLSVAAGDLILVGALSSPEESSDPPESRHLFGLDVPRGLFHIWEVEGEMPECAEEREARENFHHVTRTAGSDLVIVLKAAATFQSA